MQTMQTTNAALDSISIYEAFPQAAIASRVREWKASKKVSMTRKQVRRCAKDLGLSTAAVRDAMNAAGIEYKFG